MKAEFMFYNTKQGIKQAIKTNNAVIRNNNELINQLKQDNKVNKKFLCMLKNNLKNKGFNKKQFSDYDPRIEIPVYTGRG